MIVTGVDATAIFAQSVNATGFGGNIGITIGNATTGTDVWVSGGAGAGNAVAFSGGATNTLTNYGTLTTVAAIGGMTVTGGVGNEAITNYGHIIGSIDLGGGTNAIDNKPYASIASRFSGVFDSGTTVNLGGTAAGDLFTNEGVVSPGGIGRVLTTNVNGNFVQTAPGSCGTFGTSPTSTCGYYALDLDLNRQIADRINITGAAAVSGAVAVNIDNAGYALPGTATRTILSAAGGETHSNLSLQAYQTAVSSYALLYPNATDIDLQYSINFSPAGLTRNQHAVGDAVNAIQSARSSPNFAPIAAALFYQPNVATLGQVYNSISGEGVATVEQTAFQANDQFHGSVFQQAAYWLFDDEKNLPNSQVFYNTPLAYAADGVTDGLGLTGPRPAAPSSDLRTLRMWFTNYGGSAGYAANATVGSAATSDLGGGFTTGLDYQLSPHFLVGAAAGYGTFSFSVPDRATTGTVNATHAAAYAAIRADDAYAVAMLDFDYFANQENRTAAIPGTAPPAMFGAPVAAIPGFLEQDSGRFGSYAASGLFETGYRFHLDSNIELKPLIGTQFSYLRMNGFTESAGGGASTIGLSYAAQTVPSVPAYAGAQFDVKKELSGGYSLYSWLRGEWVHEFDPQRSIEATFIAAPGFPFTIQGAQGPSDFPRLNTGMKFNVSDHLSFTASFNADLYTTPSYSGTAGIRFTW